MTSLPLSHPKPSCDKPSFDTPSCEKPLRDLRALTPARVGLGRTGASLPTQALLAFTLDHARARDAVHATFDKTALISGLSGLSLEGLDVSSQVADRKDYLRRPDLGRKLDKASRERLANHATGAGKLVIVIGDGLSPAAVNAHAIELVRNLMPRLDAYGIKASQAVVASGARVALGDEIGIVLGARLILMLIGERPGLSTPDSLGAYLTFAPRAGLSDADRNCVSNIHRMGLGYEEASLRIAWLIRESFARQISGVVLKDESGGLQRLAPMASRQDHLSN